MEIETNEKLIRRNGLIGQYTMLASLLVLGSGLFISFRYPSQVTLSFGLLLIGFVLSQLGIYFSSRWGRRPDELLNQALKGLDGRYRLYHYRTPASHLLVGPAGVWVIIPRSQKGIITFSRNRYRQQGGGPLQAYLRVFAQEGLGRPEAEVDGEVARVKAYLAKVYPDDAGSAPDVQGVLVFTHPDADVRIGEDEAVPAPTLAADKLKEFIRKMAKGKPISMERVKELQEIFSNSAQK
jgi:hypothetical protein